MLEDKINKYYNQLLEYSYKYCHDQYVIDYKHSIKYVLKELIEKNNERYLTNSFLDFIACESYYIWHFSFILKDELRWNYRIFNAYFESLLSDFSSMEKHQQDDYHLFTKLLDNETLKNVIYYRNFFEARISKDQRNDYLGYLILRAFFASLLSYCLMHNKMNDFINLFERLMSESDNIIDYYRFKSPCDEITLINPFDGFYNMLEEYIENGNINKKVIK